jgi:hypothetical protein
MSQAKWSVISSDDLAEQQEVCGYIFDLLGSLETIATQHKLSVLAQLIAMAKREAKDCV